MSKVCNIRVKVCDYYLFTIVLKFCDSSVNYN